MWRIYTLWFGAGVIIGSLATALMTEAANSYLDTILTFNR